MAEAEAEAEMQGKSRCDAEPPLPFTLSHSCECAHSLWHVFCGFCPAAAAGASAAAVSLLGQHQQLDSSGFQQSSSCLGRQRNWTNECEMRNASATIRSVGSLPLPAFVTRAVSSCCCCCCACVCVYCCYRLIYWLLPPLPPPLLHFICPCSLFVYSFAYCCCKTLLLLLLSGSWEKRARILCPNMMQTILFHKNINRNKGKNNCNKQVH